jgi:hypothetical protein
MAHLDRQRCVTEQPEFQLLSSGQVAACHYVGKLAGKEEK